MYSFVLEDDESKPLHLNHQETFAYECDPCGGINQPLVLLERLCSESGETGTPFPLAPLMWRCEPGIIIAEGRPGSGGGDVEEIELPRRTRLLRVGPTDGARDRERDREVPMGEGVCLFFGRYSA